MAKSKRDPNTVDLSSKNYRTISTRIRIRHAKRNAVESIHSSFRKATKKGAFPNENALLKVLYLRVKELERKWEGGHIQNWSLAMNQLLMDHRIKDRVLK